MRCKYWLFCLALTLLLGCGSRSYDSASPSVAISSDGWKANGKKDTGGATHVAYLAGDVVPAAEILAEGKDGGREPQAPARPAADSQRKIIYTAQVNLVVEDFSDLESRVRKLVAEFGGYLAQASVDRTHGRQRSGRWQARVPVAKFDDFLDAVCKLGVPENRQRNAQDVTEEYVDLEARIANKKRLEERILAILDGANDKIKDVIEVERELARVRGEIERMQGRLRYLANHTQLTSVTITAREQRDYVPPQAPTFTTRTAQAWSASLHALRRLGQSVAVFSVAALPWLAVLGVLASPPLWYVRRRRQAS